MRLFVFGLGYVGLRLARSLMAEGWTVAGTCRTAERRAALTAEGVEAFVFAGDHPMENAATALAGTTHLLSTVYAAGRAGASEAEMHDPVVRHHGADIAALANLDWAGMISATGVYGRADGAWVDEEFPVAAPLDGGGTKVVAERQWIGLHADHGVPIHIFRSAFIYGPGRSQLHGAPRGELIRVDMPGNVTCRIHVDDFVRVLRASIARPDPGRIYNVADDTPAENRAVVEHACALMGVDPPPLRTLDELSPRLVQLFSDSRRIANGRIRQELGVALLYPGYREGFAAMVETEQADFAEEQHMGGTGGRSAARPRT